MESPVSKEEVSEEVREDVKEELKKVEDDKQAVAEAVAKELSDAQEDELNARLQDEEKVAEQEEEDKKVADDLLKQFEKENESKLAVNQGATIILEGAEVASYTVIAIQLLQVSLKGTEFFADVGASLPIIGVALKFIAIVGKQIQGHFELHKILDELKVILKQLQKLLELIQFVYNTFRNEIRKFYTERINKMRVTNGVKLQDMIKLMDELKELFKIKLHPVIELKVKEKLNVVVNILKSIKGASESDDSPAQSQPSQENLPQMDTNKSSFTRIANAIGSATKTLTSNAQKFGSYVKRTGLSLTSASTYKNEVLESMIFENSLMFLYHSQYIMVIHEYEEALRKIKPFDGVDARDGNALIESIWGKIKNVEYENDGKTKKANPYNDYLVDNDDASNSTSESPSESPSVVRPAESTSNETAIQKPKSFLPSIFGRKGGKRKTKRREKRPLSKTKKNLRGKTKKSKHQLKKRRV